MKPITAELFLERAAAVGIGFDPRYRQSNSLIFLPPNDASRFWPRPSEPPRWPHFLASILSFIDASETITACRWRSGPRPWPDSATAEFQGYKTHAVFTEALEIPSGWPGAVEFDGSDRQLLIAVMVAHFIDPICDLIVVPACGGMFMQLSHHDVVHVSASTTDRIKAIVSAMASAKYPLPDEIPDATFKRPQWMPPNQRE
jgi:hypothetical protein